MKLIISILISLLIFPSFAQAKPRIYCPKVVDCTVKPCVMYGGTPEAWEITYHVPEETIYLATGADGKAFQAPKSYAQCRYKSMSNKQLYLDSLIYLYVDFSSHKWNMSDIDGFCIAKNGDTLECPFLEHDKG